MPESRAAFWSGFRDCSPFILVVAPFGLLFGVVATEAGLNLLETMAMTVLVIAGVGALVAVKRHGVPETPTTTPDSQAEVPNQPKPRTQSKSYVKPGTVPQGYETFLEQNQMKRLNQVTETMRQSDLPSQILGFYKAEIFNRDHWDVTRNNMANALVWQENPDPNLHRLFIRMLEDKDEDPVWRDYCLQFLSECLRSSSGPELVKSKIREYSLKTGTATVKNIWKA